mmetsp:Transcript_22730/g.53040  ORF Transcript_22730/g.53040 Transcript_22730/m.53040 type:complete len:508 (+) Transcript_22730:65-1588(+)
MNSLDTRLRRCLTVILIWMSRLVFPSAAYNYGSLISKADEYCYAEFVKDPSCCIDQRYDEGVSLHKVKLVGAEWNCDPKNHCWDSVLGDRGVAGMAIPEGASCETPRILYIHGGSWEYGSPFSDGYPQLITRLANLTGFVVFAPDYKLAPLGNFSTILQTSLDSLDWLAKHGPVDGGVGDCELPVPPLFIGGDSSGGGTALSTVMAINELPSRAPYEGKVQLAGAFFFSPWTNLECNTPDYYHHAYAKIVTPDDDGDGSNRVAYVGDLMFRGHPLLNKVSFTGNALDYVGGHKELLTDPIASPLYTETDHWREVPPLYFAVGGSESILGDSVLFAQKASHQRVEVQLDVYEGMWHVFPMYSEGCGSGTPLWQALSALRRAAKFVQSIAFTGHPACSSHPGVDGDNPYTEFHYNNPKGDTEWFASEDACAHLFPDWDVTQKYSVTKLALKKQQLSAQGATITAVFFGMAFMGMSLVALWLFASKRRLQQELSNLHVGGYLNIEDTSAP